MSRIFLFLTFFLSISFSGFSQYKISLKFKNADNQKVQFAYYYEDKQFVLSEDTLSAGGACVFEGDENLLHGIYMIILPDKPTYFDLLITEEQNFSISTDADAVLDNIKVKGSKENEIFYAYQKKMTAFNKKAADIEALSEVSVIDSVQKQKQDDELKAEFEAIRDKQIQDYPNAFITKLLKTMSAPENETDLWADVDLSEAGLIRTPFFVNVVRTHIGRFIEAGADKIIFENKKLLQKAEVNKEMHDYLAFYLMSFYRTFLKAGMNRVFVQLADTYFLADTTQVSDPKMRELIQNQRDIFHASFPGEPARNIRMANMAGDSVSLYDVKADMTLVFFWSSGCGHCKDAIAFTSERYAKLQSQNIRVFAINTNETYLSELKKYLQEKPMPWENYHDIKNYSRYKEYFYTVSAPLMYVLDSNKIIRRELVGKDEIEYFIGQIAK